MSIDKRIRVGGGGEITRIEVVKNKKGNEMVAGTLAFSQRVYDEENKAKYVTSHVDFTCDANDRLVKRIKSGEIARMAQVDLVAAEMFMRNEGLTTVPEGDSKSGYRRDVQRFHARDLDLVSPAPKERVKLAEHNLENAAKFTEASGIEFPDVGKDGKAPRSSTPYRSWTFRAVADVATPPKNAKKGHSMFQPRQNPRDPDKTFVQTVLESRRRVGEGEWETSHVHASGRANDWLRENVKSGALGAKAVLDISGDLVFRQQEVRNEKDRTFNLTHAYLNVKSWGAAAFTPKFELASAHNAVARLDAYEAKVAEANAEAEQGGPAVDEPPEEPEVQGPGDDFPW